MTLSADLYVLSNIGNSYIPIHWKTLFINNLIKILPADKEIRNINEYDSNVEDTAERKLTLIKQGPIRRKIRKFNSPLGLPIIQPQCTCIIITSYFNLIGSGAKRN